MERDVELQLTQRMASIEATLVGFAKDVSRRFDEQADSLREIEAQVRTTNGRVTTLERINAVRDERENAVREALGKVSPTQVPVVASSVITLAEIKWWIAIAVGCLTTGAGVTVWILTLVGKL